MLTKHTILVRPSPKKRDDDTNASGRFDAIFRGAIIAERTHTPFCDAARAMLAKGYAKGSDQLEMQHIGSDTIALRSTVGTAARTTVTEDGTKFIKWRPPPSI